MLDVIAATAVVKLVSDSVGLVDRVYDSWRKYTEQRKVEKSSQTEFYEKITSSKDNKALVHLLNGKPSRTITIDELKTKLSNMDKNHIEALERRLEINVRAWDGKLLKSNSKQMWSTSKSTRSNSMVSKRRSRRTSTIF